MPFLLIISPICFPGWAFDFCLNSLRLYFSLGDPILLHKECFESLKYQEFFLFFCCLEGLNGWENGKSGVLLKL